MKGGLRRGRLRTRKKALTLRSGILPRPGWNRICRFANKSNNHHLVRQHSAANLAVMLADAGAPAVLAGAPDAVMLADAGTPPAPLAVLPPSPAPPHRRSAAPPCRRQPAPRGAHGTCPDASRTRTFVPFPPRPQCAARCELHGRRHASGGGARKIVVLTGERLIEEEG